MHGSAGTIGRPKMSEGGDILYAKLPSTKPRTQQQLQQTADKARKHIPGAARLLAADTAALGCCRRPQGGGGCAGLAQRHW